MINKRGCMQQIINQQIFQQIAGGNKFTLNPANLAETITDLKYLQGGLIALGSIFVITAGYDIAKSLLNTAASIKQIKLDLREYELSEKMRVKTSAMLQEAAANYQKCAEATKKLINE